MHSMLRLIYFIIFSFISTFLYATSSPDYSAIDARVKKMPAKHLKSIHSLVGALVEKQYSDTEKTRAIYMWIIRNIKWDNDSVNLYLKTGDIKDLKPNTPESVFKTRKGVCAGFAHLFKKLADLAGLKAVTIFGYYKGAAAYYQEKLGRGPDHVWNAVKLGDNWFTIDTAYGSLHRTFEYYYLADPAVFIRTHFPAESKFQFLTPPVTRETFEKGASVHAAFFNDHLSDLKPNSLFIHTKTGEKVNISLTVPDNIKVFGSVKSGNQKTDIKVDKTRAGTTTVLSTTFTKKWQYNLFIASKDKMKKTSYQMAVLYVVKVE